MSEEEEEKICFDITDCHFSTVQSATVASKAEKSRGTVVFSHCSTESSSDAEVKNEEGSVRNSKNDSLKISSLEENENSALFQEMIQKFQDPKSILYVVSINFCVKIILTT